MNFEPYEIGQTVCLYLSDRVIKGEVTEITDLSLCLNNALSTDGKSVREEGDVTINIADVIAQGGSRTEKGEALKKLAMDVNFLPPLQKDKYAHLRTVAERMTRRIVADKGQPPKFKIFEE
ncbi:MAG: hypothetical protein IJX05_04575 [Clostridia bacterium]|nr:hypothetical protein [Clostridia bacterium]